jgi:hypothetical protein
MDITLHLSDAETEALSRRARREGCSPQDLARRAVLEHLDRDEGERPSADEELQERLPRLTEAQRRLDR